MRHCEDSGSAVWNGLGQHTIDLKSPSYTLKVRGGAERDSGGKKAGKGPLIQVERSATLGVSQDQYLFVEEVSRHELSE